MEHILPEIEDFEVDYGRELVKVKTEKETSIIPFRTLDAFCNDSEQDICKKIWEYFFRRATRNLAVKI